MNNFQVLIHEPRDGVLVLSLSGELDLFTSQPVRDAAALAIGDHSYQCVVFDLTNLAFMDSSGLHILADTHRAMRASGRTVRIVSQSDRIAKMFELTGLDRLLTVVPDRDSALALAA